MKSSAETTKHKKGSESKKKNSIASKITERLRSLVRERFFPKISPDGYCYLSPHGKVGTDAQKKRTVLSDPEVQCLLKDHFPSYPLYKLPNPEFEAFECKGQGFWTSESVSKAADLFCVPAQTEVVIVFPDLFDRKELRKNERFRTDSNPDKVDSDGGRDDGHDHRDDSDEGIGVLTPCPWCKTNSHVKFSEWSVQKWKERPRVSVGKDAAMLPLLGPLYKCANPECAGKPLPRCLKEIGNHAREKHGQKKLRKGRLMIFVSGRKNAFQVTQMA